MRHDEYTPWQHTLQLWRVPAMGIREVLAANLRRYRRERQLSQEELAHRAGIDRTYVSALERCLYSASIDMVEKLARELEVAVVDLLRPE